MTDDPELDRRLISMVQGLRRRGHAVIFKDQPAAPGAPLGRLPSISKQSFLWAYIGKLCPYCAVAMSGSGKGRPSRDHVFPRAAGHSLRGGKNRLIVCSACNHDKGSMLPVDFLAWLERIGDGRARFVRAAYATLGIVAPGAIRNYDGHIALRPIAHSNGGLNMPDVKTVNASDNPNHADEEKKRSAQRDRDQAEINREQAKTSEMASRQTTPEERAREAQQGRGPAGINTGPSDTSSADPKNPPGYPTRGNPTGAIVPRSEGMGTSPPQGEQPRGDKPEDDRKLPGELPGATPAQQEEARRQRADMNSAKGDRQDAQADMRDAERRIGENQSKPVSETDRERRDREDRDHRR